MHVFRHLVIILFTLISLTLCCQESLPCQKIEQEINDVIESDLFKCKFLINKLLICEKNNAIPQSESKSNYYKAKYLVSSGNIDDAQRVIALELRNQTNHNTIIDLRLLQSICFIIKNEFSRSLTISNQIVSDRKATALQLAKAFQYISSAHAELGNKKYQIESLIKGSYFAKRCGNAVVLAAYYNNLGHYYSYFKGGDFRKSVTYFKKAITILPPQDSATLALYMTNLGVSYCKFNMYQKSIRALLNVWNTYAKSLDAEQNFHLAMSLGSAYLELINLRKANYYYKKAKEIYEVLPNKALADQVIYYNLSELEYYKGNIPKSYDYLKTYLKLYEKYVNIENEQKIISMQERFNAKARRAEILELRNKHQSAKLEAYFLQEVILISSIVSVILVLTYIYFQRKRALADRIRAKYAIRKSALEATENEKYRISRELHDSVGGTLMLSGMLMSRTKELHPQQSDEFEQLNQQIQSSIIELQRICRNLFPSEILVSGVISSLTFYFERLSVLNPSISFVFSSEDMKLEKGFSVNIYRIIQQLTNNSMKHAEASRIDTNLIVKDGRLNLVYSDNGKGLDLKMLKKGIGLNSIEERTKAYKGTFRIESQPKKGFTLFLSFPVEDILLNE
jgi:signal transduction histidine kinase